MYSFYQIPTCFLLVCSVVSISNGLQCRDQNNQPVDWFVVYKLPRQTSNSNRFIKEGLAFMYMTSNNYSEWILSNVDINDTSSMVAHTLQGLYGNHYSQQKNLYILYNDQPPYSPFTLEKGHTKGVVMADSSQGFWLIHSVPHFPYLGDYSYPKTGEHFGQSFLCISLDLKNVNSVGLQLQYNEPYIYAANVPDTLTDSLPDILKAANNETIKNAPWYNVENIATRGGVKFVSFAKSGKFNKDLYADLVSSQLETDLYVETWPNEPNRLPSDCDKKYQVDNVLSMSIPEPSIFFKSTVDHSKWAVSAPNDSQKWICIGDINRAETQTQRGGGTTCLNNDKLASQYQKIVSSIQNCKNANLYEVYSNFI